MTLLEPAHLCTRKCWQKQPQPEEGRTGWLWLFRLGRNVWDEKYTNKLEWRVRWTWICFTNCLETALKICWVLLNRVKVLQAVDEWFELEVGGTFLLSTLYITLHELVQPSCQYFQKIFLSFLLNKNISWQIPIIFQYERDMRGYRQGQWLLIRPNLLCLLFWPVSSVLSLLTLLSLTATQHDLLHLLVTT